MRAAAGVASAGSTVVPNANRSAETTVEPAIDSQARRHASANRAQPASPRKRPLEGIRVLDVTLVWAGPHCTQLLAEWGAEVIRVEPLQRIQPSTRGAELRLTKAAIAAMPDAGRGQIYHYPDSDPGPRPWNTSAEFNSHARNKRSITLDVMTEEGLDILRRLVALSDVLVENNAPETIERAHLTYDELTPFNPNLIALRMPAYGLNGPYKNYRSFGNHMESMTGHHYLRGYRDLDPSMTSASFTADAAGGVQGALAVMLALQHRRRTGRGQQIELATAENFLPYLGEVILDYTMNGRVQAPRGNEHPTHAPHGVYPCRGDDRWIAIDIATDAEWEALCAVAGEQPWCADARFASGDGRRRHRAELDGEIGRWTAAHDRFELFSRLQAVGVAAGPVQDEEDAFRCPQLADRGFFEELEHPEAGRHRYPGLNFRMAGTPNRLYRYACRLGEDNDYVYRDVLQLSDREYESLKQRGHIGMDYPPSAYAPRGDLAGR
jgi:crotonobetainyl-CoA:carnitine CoA-transferase CaiB-like acyl-CoA transferase